MAIMAVSAADVEAAPVDSKLPPEASAEYLFGMTPGMDLERFVDRPRLVDTVNYVFTDPASGERRLAGYAEVVAVYDIPLTDLVAVATDFAASSSYAPRIMESFIQRQDGADYHLYYKVGIKFMGIEVSFRSTFTSTVERLGGGAVGIRSRLTESIDESEYEHYTSIYFAPVTVNGRTMTMIRYFNRPGIRNPSAGMLQVLNIFAPPEARGQVAAIAKEAVRRSGKR
jgi:hypothetical protein